MLLSETDVYTFCYLYFMACKTALITLITILVNSILIQLHWYTLKIKKLLID